MSRWKNHLVAFTTALSSLSFGIFLATGYTALYWAWLRADLQTAMPFLPWARNFGMLAMACAAVAFGILFSSKIFPLPPQTRLSLSLLATATIGFFSEFRNEGKFHFKTLVHFFGPGTWIHDRLNQVVSGLGDSLYRIEYSHWNDFLMGPAIVSVLFPLVFLRLYGAVRNPAPISLRASTPDTSTDQDQALRFARTLMNVGLFWFFITAWAEKAGYISNPHSNDEIDLPFEFAGTMLGFWMVRALTKPFDKPSERFRSTLLIDFLSSGLMGLLYTLIVGSLTEGVASAVAHALYPVVPGSLDIHEYTPFQQHMRPFELLLLAGGMWWGLNRSSRREEITRLSGIDEAPEADSRWDVLMTLAKVLGATTGYLLIVVTMLSWLEPQGLGWTLATAGAGLLVGTAAFLLARHAGRQSFTTVLGGNDDTSRT
ncbi:MAG TPA: hypothetical protein VN893_19135 [Bryobacteraceae bacterium]|nr:hypothetical protein [Bryobacteraceae bacterium]